MMHHATLGVLGACGPVLQSLLKLGTFGALPPEVMLGVIEELCCPAVNGEVTGRRCWKSDGYGARCLLMHAWAEL